MKNVVFKVFFILFICFCFCVFVYAYRYKYFTVQYKYAANISEMQNGLQQDFSSALFVINNAGVEELQKIPGISPKIAGQIVVFREKNGAYTYLEDLQYVKGIGKKTLLKIKNYFLEQ